jgi:quercetin 2,3-dioxygenase
MPYADASSAASATPLAPVTVRRDRDIYAADGGWFRARWHFSFDEYHDPQNMGVGKLRVFNHDTLAAGAVWPMHPHTDVEGITYVLAGVFEHADSLGNDGVLLPGAVQRMRLGSGALHSERNHSQSEPMQFIQLWILPSHRGLQPGVEQVQYGLEDRHNRLLRIVRPEGEPGTGVTAYQDASVYVSRLDPGVGVEHVLPDRHGGYLYLIVGEIALNGERLATGDAAKILGRGALDVQAHAASELILVDTVL